MKILLPWFLLCFFFGLWIADKTYTARQRWNKKMGKWGEQHALYICKKLFK